MRKFLLLVMCLGLLAIGSTAFAGGLNEVIKSWRQIKHDYKEYHQMNAFDKDGNLQQNNIRVYMENQSGAVELTDEQKQRYIDTSPLSRGRNNVVQYKHIPQSNNMRQVEDMNRLFDKLGITADPEPAVDNSPAAWDIPVHEGITVITRRVK